MFIYFGGGKFGGVEGSTKKVFEPKAYLFTKTNLTPVIYDTRITSSLLRKKNKFMIFV